MAAKRIANYEVEATTKDGLFLRDVGPWSMFPTITNSAEEVVKELVELGRVKPGQRIFYRDSEGERTELIVQDGQFHSFAPGVSQ